MKIYESEQEKPYEEIDYTVAFNMLMGEAQKGDPRAQTQIGFMYQVGAGVPKSIDTALGWYKKAAAQNYTQAQHRISVMYGPYADTPNLEKAIKWCRMAAEQGYVPAQLDLGFLYLDLTNKGIRDYSESKKWYLKVFEQGKAEGANALGNLYKRQGNYPEAFKWYMKAYDMGEAWGAIFSAELYEELKDYSNAIKWYAIAIDFGESQGAMKLGALYKKQKDYTNALKWYRKAGELGASWGPLEVGKIYEKQKDYAAAQKWYQKAKIPAADYALTCLARTTKLANLNLFGVKLETATRKEMRAALDKKNVPHIRVEDGYWADVYNSSSILADTSKLIIFYTLEERFAFAVYVFPNRMDVNKVVEVKDMVEQKYGDKMDFNGTPDVGKITYLWEIEEGKITVERGWPDTTVFLTFAIPRQEQQYKSQKKAQDQQAKQKKFQSQFEVF
ncbi:tetratricopeptide repeat protein [Desulfovibrio sp. Huiquan2017]|uniref:SEL1-like repeat protein n=1 Tax=Desulfovibrio sp. Huiquan2017 TaxID=2816861 RepID=UPI001A93A645|nr:tetratricopeptide repeat protein [Desulfovibrio sp. Huiquan2017]